MNLKKLKSDARKSLKRNFFRTILVVFIANIIINGGYSYSSYVYDSKFVSNISPVTTSYTALKTFMNNIFDDGTEVKRGILAPLIENISENKNVSVGFISFINNMVFNENLSSRMVSLIGLVVSILLYIFIQNVFKVGRSRYFLEQRRYKYTKVDKLLFPYQVKKTLHMAYILFIRDVKLLLWLFTIVGLPIKYYEYKMIPYILAENPNVTLDEAFKISKELTSGYKIDMFILDLSMIGWYILQLLTLGISSMFYFNAYKESIYTELYMSLRNTKKSTSRVLDLLNDKYLDIKDYQDKAYPKEKFSIPYISSTLNSNVDKKYSFISYLMMFYIFSMVGWIWEVILGFVTTGEFVNRGALHGPWLPLYGAGCVLILVLLRKLTKKPVLFFITTMILCGFIEYTTAWYLETFKSLRWWYYDGFFMNLHGRICLEGLLVFGLGGSAVTYFAAPILDNLINKIPKKICITICVILSLTFGYDFIDAQIHPNIGNGVTVGLMDSE